MQVRIRPPDLPRETRRRVEQSVRLALGRYGAGLRALDVTFRPGPNGAGPGVGCRMRARRRDGGSLVVEDHGSDASVAAAHAVWRLAHRLERSDYAEPPRDRATSAGRRTVRTPKGGSS